jgi:hypothetical protein
MHLVLIPFSVVTLLLGIAIAAGAKTAPELFVGLTLVICAVMMLCAGAIVGAINAMRGPPAAQPLQPPHQMRYPLS